MNIVFRIADEQGMLLLDLKDLRALLTDVASRRAELTIAYGAVSPQSIGAIQRRLLTLETQGGDAFFGEPALDLNDLIRHDARGPWRREHPEIRCLGAAATALCDGDAMAFVGAI